MMSIKDLRSSSRIEYPLEDFSVSFHAQSGLEEIPIWHERRQYMLSRLEDDLGSERHEMA